MPELPTHPSLATPSLATPSLRPDASEEATVPNCLRKKMFGEWLAEFKMVTPRQLQIAMTAQGDTGGFIGEILVQQGVISTEEKNAVKHLQQMLGRHTALGDLPLDPAVLSVLTSQFARKSLVLPLLKTQSRLFVAMGQHNPPLLDQMQMNTGLSVHAVVFPEPDLQVAMDRFYGAKASALEAVDRAIKNKPVLGGAGQGRRVESLDKVGQEAPVIELVNSILMDAIKKDASDIHFDAREEALAVRYRIDGVLATMMEVPKTLEPSVITRIKVLAEMNITERRRSQDGRFSVDMQGARFDFRAAVVATHWGEKVTLRILRPMSMLRGLEKIGFSPADILRFRKMITAPSGMVLVTGPTGSGKTSTLYSAIGSLDRETMNIMTVEDPIEYAVVGVNQSQIMAKIGVTFAESLRAMLRQDPDVVMMGEIRDMESLETATNAALTGQLVLSTIHTNSAMATVTRMLDMGVAPYLVSATLVGVVAQRLLRRVCTKCATDVPATSEEKQFMKISDTDELLLLKGQGCEFCNNTGYRGRLPVFECLLADRQFQELVSENAPLHALRSWAEGSGMTTMHDDARRKIMAQMTTPKEAIRVLGSLELF